MAERMRRTKAPVLPASVLAKLGTDTDKAVAEAAGVDENKVYRARRAAGIAPFAANKGAKYLWTPENELLLGTMPDTELAARLGIKQNSVVGARQRRGVPAFQPQHLHPSAQQIAKARERAGHSPEAAAAAAGYEGPTAALNWRQFERGVRKMPRARFLDYLRATGQIPTP